MNLTKPGCLLGVEVVQFRAGGHAYLFLCYGTNVMLNVVADKAGVGAAVLIRACSPVAGDYPTSIFAAVETKNRT